MSPNKPEPKLVEPLLPIGVLMRILRRTLDPPVQMKDVMDALQTTDYKRVANIETGLRPFPIVHTEAVAKAMRQDTEETFDYFKLCAHYSRATFILNKDTTNPLLWLLIALHEAGCFSDVSESLETYNRFWKPVMPESVKSAMEKSVQNAKDKTENRK